MSVVQKYEFLPLLFHAVCCLQSKSFYFRAMSRAMKRYSLTKHRPSKLLNPGDKSVERLNKLILKMLSLNSGNSSTVLLLLMFSSISDLF